MNHGRRNSDQTRTTRRRRAIAAFVGALALVAPLAVHAQTTSSPLGVQPIPTPPPAGTPTAPGPAPAAPVITPSNPIATPPGPSGEPTHPAPPTQGKGDHGAHNPPPAASTQSVGNSVILENADLMRLGEDNIVHATGNVRIAYRDYTLYADQATLDTDSGIATFTGNVHLIEKSKVVDVNSKSPQSKLILNLRTGNYSIVGPEHTTINPTFFSNTPLILPLQIETADLVSQSGVIDARGVGFTTCDFPEPHYDIGVRSLTIVPGKHLIARHATFYRRGHRLFTLPELVLPLDNRYANQNYLPMVGSSPAEGYFVKFAIPYALAAAAVEVLHLDYLSAEGIGNGFDQSYRSHGDNAGGTLSLYQLNNRASGLNELTGSLVHRQSIGDFLFNLNTQYQNNSYFASTGSSENLTSQFSLARNKNGSNTLLTSTMTQSNYGFGESSTNATSLQQQQQLSKTSSADLKLDYAGNVSPGYSGAAASQNSSLSTALGYHFQPSGLQVDVESNFFNAIQNGSSALGGISSFGGLEKRPEIMLTTTNKGGNGDPLDMLARLLPGSQAQLGFGSYLESASNADTDRLYFGYDLGNHTKKLGDVTTTTNSSFQQSFYGDGAAQYMLTGHYNSDYRRGPLDFGASYSTLRAYGYTPFLFDAAGDYNNASLNLSYSPGHVVTFTAATAYDFLRDQGQYGLPAAPWQNLLGVLKVQPNKDFVNTLQATYDPNHGELFDVNNDLLIKSSSGFNFQTALDYIPQMHTFGIINGSLDLPIILDKREQSGYKIQALAGYNGLDSEFTYQGLAVTRSWHDWELTGTFENNPEGIQPGKTFYITFHLKALPGYQPFGIGSLGQGITPGVSQVY